MVVSSSCSVFFNSWTSLLGLSLETFSNTVKGNSELHERRCEDDKMKPLLVLPPSLSVP